MRHARIDKAQADIVRHRLRGRRRACLLRQAGNFRLFVLTGP